jgi:hypothetical protein
VLHTIQVQVHLQPYHTTLTLTPNMNMSPGYIPVEIGYAFAFGRAVFDDLASLCRNHNLHMNERNRQFLRLEYSCREKLVEVRRRYYFRAIRTARKEVSQDSSKEARAICSELHQDIGKAKR